MCLCHLTGSYIIIALLHVSRESQEKLKVYSLAEVNLARGRADKWNSDQSRVDRTVRELRSQVDDLTEALSAKDGQLAVLKVRLDEADQLLKARSSALEEAQSERIRWLSVTSQRKQINNDGFMGTVLKESWENDL